mmetsp:Transcript_16015/g.36053  ORF Transcript_16015/g.36053 Transcript_16015/m.36053 type:complete len:200 (-) Transcript_16015:415-1014(-)
MNINHFSSNSVVRFGSSATFPDDDMDDEAVESNRSYKKWLALPNGTEMFYDQYTYEKGKQGDDDLLRKKIWCRMRYRRKRKSLTTAMKKSYYSCLNPKSPPHYHPQHHTLVTAAESVADRKKARPQEHKAGETSSDPQPQSPKTSKRTMHVLVPPMHPSAMPYSAVSHLLPHCSLGQYGRVKNGGSSHYKLVPLQGADT